MTTATDRVRVLRVLEYDFESLDAMNFHFAQAEVPLQGERRFGSHMTVRSTALFPQGKDVSLFTVQSEAPAPPVPDTPVIVLGASLTEAIEWGQEHLEFFVVLQTVSELREHLDSAAGPLVAVELPSWGTKPEHFAMRSALYSHDVTLCSAAEWEETHG